jgi:hypothetical protein
MRGKMIRIISCTSKKVCKKSKKKVIYHIHTEREREREKEEELEKQIFLNK